MGGWHSKPYPNFIAVGEQWAAAGQSNSNFAERAVGEQFEFHRLLRNFEIRRLFSWPNFVSDGIVMTTCSVVFLRRKQIAHCGQTAHLGLSAQYEVFQDDQSHADE
nr:hypothetical protein Itr_chr11CG15950 [Ipomoea trifida]